MITSRDLLTLLIIVLMRVHLKYEHVKMLIDASAHISPRGRSNSFLCVQGLTTSKFLLFHDSFTRSFNGIANLTTSVGTATTLITPSQYD